MKAILAHLGTIDWRGYRLAAWAVLAVQLGLVVATPFQAPWVVTLVPAGFLAVSLAYLLWERHLPALFDLLGVTASAVNAAGWCLGYFDDVEGYDELAHVLGVLAVASLAGLYGYRRMIPAFAAHPLTFALTVVAVGMALGSLWEVAEWVVPQVLLGKPIESLSNVIKDTVANTVGALLAGWLAVRAVRTGHVPPPDGRHRPARTRSS